MVPLLFLVISTAFIVTLIQSVLNLLNYDWEGKESDAKSILSIFKWPILIFVLFILFIAFGISLIEGS